jgi:hypothetical protein
VLGRYSLGAYLIGSFASRDRASAGRAPLPGAPQRLGLRPHPFRGLPVQQPRVEHVHHAGGVHRDGQMVLRWAAAGMLEAGKQFRRVNGHLHLPALRAALEAEVRKTVGPAVHDEDINAA